MIMMVMMVTIDHSIVVNTSHKTVSIHPTWMNEWIGCMHDVAYLVLIAVFAGKRRSGSAIVSRYIS